MHSDEEGNPDTHLFIASTRHEPTDDCFGRTLWEKCRKSGPTNKDILKLLCFIDGCNEILPGSLTPEQRKEAEFIWDDFKWVCSTEHAFSPPRLDDEERAVRQILTVLPSNLLSTDSSMPIHGLQDLGLPPAPKPSDSDPED